MKAISVECLLEKTGSVYKLAILASKRALQLNDGEQPLVKKEKKLKFSTVALREIQEGKISFKRDK